VSIIRNTAQKGGEGIVAKAEELHGPAAPRTPGSMRGEIWIAPDFDELPDDIAAAFGMNEPQRSLNPAFSGTARR
jgi:hypothetical protein